jgi:hypothetical protein
VGTIWAVIHEPPDDQRSSRREPREYDREDQRMLEALVELAAAAYEVWTRSSSDSRAPSSIPHASDP